MLIKKALPVARRLTSLCRNPSPLGSICIRNSSHGHPPSTYTYPTMDDLPVPCGDWHEDYCNRQRKYNLHLFVGTGFFVVTVAVAYFSGLMWCNMFPPERPGPIPEPVC